MAEHDWLAERFEENRTHPRGRLLMVLRFTITTGTIVAIDAVAGPERLRQLDLALLTD